MPIKTDCENKITKRADETMQLIAKTALDSARGNSGTIIAQYFYGLSKSFNGLENIYIQDFAIIDKLDLELDSGLCVLSGEKSLAFNRTAALVGKKTELIWSHAHDYDTYLDDLHKKEAEENIAVFIEPPGPMHPWDELVDGNALWTIEEYYPSHCRFFDYVEQELNLKVVIAAHPKTNHTDYPEYFGKRHVIRNQLIPLIKKSKLIMTHSSTALVLVAVERKPVLILTNAAFEKDIACSRSLKVTASSFGKTPIDVDQLPYSIDWQKELLADESIYSSYVQQYVKKTDSEKLNSWQILANRLKQSQY